MMLPNDLKQQIASIPTPFYLYDLALLKETLHKAQQAASSYDYLIHYAVKANANVRILTTMQSFGLGADCVSGNEIEQSLAAGFDPASIVFAGVGKSDWEIEYALDKGIFSFNCESLQEIEVINEIAAKKGIIAPVSVRINPDINANTHLYITTGIEENKFGISFSEIEKILELVETSKNIRLIGLHFHIGSQITDLEPFQHLCLKVNAIQEYLLERHILLPHLNLGGGLGIDYNNPDGESVVDFDRFFSLIRNCLKLYPGQKVHFELGRSLVAHCGSLITKVLYVKEGLKTKFVILDAGMNDLIRPALYQAYHKIEHLHPHPGAEFDYYDVVGPICESSDCFGKRVKLPHVRRGDLLVIRSTGAYGEVMASEYNLRKKPQAVYI